MYFSENPFAERFAHMSDEQLLCEYGIMPTMTLEAAIALRLELGKRGLGEDASANYEVPPTPTPLDNVTPRSLYENVMLAYVLFFLFGLAVFLLRWIYLLAIYLLG